MNSHSVEAKRFPTAEPIGAGLFSAYADLAQAFPPDGYMQFSTYLQEVQDGSKNGFRATYSYMIEQFKAAKHYEPGEYAASFRQARRKFRSTATLVELDAATLGLRVESLQTFARLVEPALPTEVTQNQGRRDSGVIDQSAALTSAYNELVHTLPADGYAEFMTYLHDIGEGRESSYPDLIVELKRTSGLGVREYADRFRTVRREYGSTATIIEVDSATLGIGLESMQALTRLVEPELQTNPV